LKKIVWKNGGYIQNWLDISKVSPTIELELGGFDNLIEHRTFDITSEAVEEHFLTSSYEKVVNIFGRFQQEAIALGLSELR